MLLITQYLQVTLITTNQGSIVIQSVSYIALCISGVMFLHLSGAITIFRLVDKCCAHHTYVLLETIKFVHLDITYNLSQYFILSSPMINEFGGMHIFFLTHSGSSVKKKILAFQLFLLLILLPSRNTLHYIRNKMAH